MKTDVATSKNSVSRLLKEELNRIQESSPKFSMRSFAKKLKVSQTELSEVINGKRKPSSRLVLNFLKLCSKSQAEYLEQIYNLERAGVKIKKKDRHLFEIEEQQFKMIAEWQHFAILSLLETHDFTHDVSWIANRIGSTKSTVEKCLQTLKYLGLVKVDRNGNLVLTNEGIKTSDEVASKAIREAHIKDLDIVKDVIQSPLDVRMRDFTSCTYAVNVKNIKKFKNLVRKFQDQVADLLEDKNADEVYRMSVYFYPLTQTRAKEQT